MKIYLDYAASTPVDPRVRVAMEPYFSDKFGNPGSLHSFGQEAMAAVDAARETLAASLGIDFRNVIFTASATEANNLALRGTIKAFSFELLVLGRPSSASWRIPIARRSLKPNSYKLKPRIIVSAIEHESVLETARALEREGVVELVIVPVGREGVVDTKKLASALDERTALVSIMYGNNEVGTIQPIAEITKLIRDFRESISYKLNAKSSLWPLFHTDAAQALQFYDCRPDELGVDLMTLSAHKIYGPKGVGGLYVSQQIANSTRPNDRSHSVGRESQIAHRSTPFAIGHSPFAIISGGGQEFGLRSGTENVPAIAGFAEAVRIADRMRDKESLRVRALATYAWKVIRKAAPKAVLNGPAIGSKDRLPHILNVYFPKQEAEELLTALDLNGIAASSGSACRSRSLEASYVIQALGHSSSRAKQSIRFSFGRGTTRGSIDHLAEVLREYEKKRARHA